MNNREEHQCIITLHYITKEDVHNPNFQNAQMRC